jgi:hypothetical protein
VRLLDHSPDRLVFAGNAGGPAFLVVSNNFDPHWMARLNDQGVPIYRANYAFQAVFISQPGPFRLVLEYHAPEIWWLHLVSLVGLGLFLGVTFLGSKAAKSGSSAAGEGVPQNFPVQEVTLKEKAGRRQGLGNCYLMGLSGLIMAFVFAGSLAYLHKLPEGEYHRVYVLFDLIGVGVLLNLWASFMARRW